MNGYAAERAGCHTPRYADLSCYRAKALKNRRMRAVELGRTQADCSGDAVARFDARIHKACRAGFHNVLLSRELVDSILGEYRFFLNEDACAKETENSGEGRKDLPGDHDG
jgi:hypothetical protein